MTCLYFFWVFIALILRTVDPNLTQRVLSIQQQERLSSICGLKSQQKGSLLSWRESVLSFSDSIISYFADYSSILHGSVKFAAFHKIGVKSGQEHNYFASNKFMKLALCILCSALFLFRVRMLFSES